MNAYERWIALDGATNVRDLGGLPTVDGGTTRFGRILRSDNLQSLTRDDIDRLVGDLKLRNVVDLRSHAEVRKEGPGPLTDVLEVDIHHLSLYTETETVDDRALPWQGHVVDNTAELEITGYYYSYLRDRPDSVVTALRVLADAAGAAVVHCAAGKDRTGVISALALAVAGATREAIIADYVATNERLEATIARLRMSETYRANLEGTPINRHRIRAENLAQLLDSLDVRFGGPLGWLSQQGWTSADTEALRGRLRD